MKTEEIKIERFFLNAENFFQIFISYWSHQIEKRLEVKTGKI